MSDILDDLNYEPDHASKPRPQHPRGWEPGVTWDGTTGEIVTPPTVGDPNWQEALADWGFDPDVYEVVEPIQFRTWDAAVGGGEVRRMKYWRAVIRSKTASIDDRQLADWILKWRKPKRLPAGEGDTALIVAPSDLQLGKPDGDGVEGTVDRFLDSIGKVQDRWRDLKRAGVNLDRLIITPLGDLREACSGHYAQQTFTVQLTERQQRKLIRRLFTKAIKEWARMTPKLVVAPVGGNHGEVRQGGKSYTDFSDNVDVAVFEDIAEVLAENPDAFGHVTFRIPDADLTATLDVHGVIVGLAHGHQARGGGTPTQKIDRWWRGQMAGRQPIGDADLLLTGHFHHLSIVQHGARTHIQAPALEGGSDWFRYSAGMSSPPGLLTVAVSADGWDHLRVL